MDSVREKDGCETKAEEYFLDDNSVHGLEATEYRSISEFLPQATLLQIDLDSNQTSMRGQYDWEEGQFSRSGQRKAIIQH